MDGEDSKLDYGEYCFFSKRVQAVSFSWQVRSNMSGHFWVHF